MKTSEILELVRAGYTKEEIAAMDTTDDEKIEHPEKKPDPEPEQKPEPKPDPEPDAETKPVKVESETEKLVKALGLKLEALTSAIQTNNVNSLEQNGGGTLTTEDVLASIIDPTYKGGK